MDRPSSWYLDLGLLSQYVEAGTRARVYHHTEPIDIIGACMRPRPALAEGLRRSGPVTTSAGGCSGRVWRTWVWPSLRPRTIDFRS